MDTSDPNIIFNDEGLCDYCQNFQSNILPNWDTGNVGREKLMRIANKIKSSGKRKRLRLYYWSKRRFR